MGVGTNNCAWGLGRSRNIRRLIQYSCLLVGQTFLFRLVSLSSVRLQLRTGWR